MYFIFSITLILLCFYLVYFSKMIIQKRKGIQTNQMAQGMKDRKLMLQEKIMRLLTFLVVIVEVLSMVFSWTLLDDSIRFIGVFISLFGLVVFIFSIVTMEDSWRAGITNEETKLITSGIYKYSRNPAFFGFYLVYIGVLISFFNVLLLVISSLAIISLHLQIIKEESNLSKIFGREYDEYKNNVNRYFGKRIRNQ